MSEIQNLLKALNAAFPESLNGAVILHFDEETKELKSISPIIPFQSPTASEDLYNALVQARDAIQLFLNDWIDRGLPKN
jgi:hypothetical protein